MRLALVSDLASTGFGRVGRELAKRWLDAGHEVRILGINFGGRGDGAVRLLNEGGKSPAQIAAAVQAVDDDPVLSRALPAGAMGDPMGHNLTGPFVRGELTKDWRADRLVVVADPLAMLQRGQYELPTWNYVPIEGSGLSPFWRRLWTHVKPVAMSRFGAREIGALLARDDVPVIPHGISPAFFRVTADRPGTTSWGAPVHSREEARKLLRWTDRTVILRTDRNVPRKDYPAFFAAIRPIIAEHPEVLVVIHCAPVDEGGALAEHLAALPGSYDNGQGWRHSQVQLTGAHDTFSGLTDNQLNLVYNAADIYASPTWAEGFGLTLAEAAACGVPVVTTDFAAGPEAVGAGGILVPPARLAANLHGHHWAVIDVPAFSEALDRLVTDPSLREQLGRAGEAHTRQFDWDAAAVSFLRLME